MPAGDMACAASPMHASPGRYHYRKRSTLTVNSFSSFQSRSSLTRSSKKGAKLDNGRAELFDPFCLHFLCGSSMDRKAALPIGAAIEQYQRPSAVGVDDQMRIAGPLGLTLKDPVRSAFTVYVPFRVTWNAACQPSFGF
jgi:hypothetical protein